MLTNIQYWSGLYVWSLQGLHNEVVNGCILLGNEVFFFTFDLNWGITQVFLCVKGAGMTDLLTGLLLSSHCMYQTRYVSSSQL